MLDKTTLEALMREAMEHYDAHLDEFEDSDCSEAMRSMEAWDTTVCWLARKLEDSQ